MATRSIKHLSSIANDVVQRCALKLGSSVEKLVEEFEGLVWKVEDSNINGGSYSRKFVEFCSAEAVKEFCQKVEEKIEDGSFSRFTFDIMLAWQMPTSAEEDCRTENVAKEREDRKRPPKATSEEDDDIPLFYSDILPLLVDNEPSAGEDAYVWLASLVPLVADVVNGRFTFETLTAPTRNRLHFPAYDKFLKEIDKSIKHLQNQAPPKGVELGDDEFILHVEGTASSQRVVRHIGGTSWPGRLTLTNYALYFEASGVLTYEDALKIDFSKDNEQSVKPAATGPWGAPLFDKAIFYESSELPEGIVLEFPELTSSTRRDHWLALTKEILLLHRFLSAYDVKCPIQAWEMHGRTILGVLRLHAAREMLRISPPEPTKFLIFALFDEIAKGDYVLEKLAESLQKVNSGHPCSASATLRRMNVRKAIVSSAEVEEVGKECLGGPVGNISSLESAINEAREEEKEIVVAKATTEELKEEGITDSTFVLIELLKPVLKTVLPWFQQVLMWERPATTLLVIAASLIIAYKEWVGKGTAGFLFWVVAKMISARKKRMSEKCNEIVVCKASDQSTMESMVSAQHGLRTVYELVQTANIALLKIWSIFISKARKHANMVMMALCGLAIIIAAIPTKYIIMGAILYLFAMTSKVGQNLGSSQGNRRFKEWWESIPVIPVMHAKRKQQYQYPTQNNMHVEHTLDEETTANDFGGISGAKNGGN
ncbi:hypothetical protein L484_008792 [Morus notabilis]|uniref:Uncharacterized protein n=1 Tax=Morus notabilis TaxID=981085 RepID=W9SXA9_9ROSA|nr:uncharacterized protein LOC21392147 [Morus notabilis]EXC31702.1 hypothetical protein L484_008792 [Morus notabilis]